MTPSGVIFVHKFEECRKNASNDGKFAQKIDFKKLKWYYYNRNV